jgi:hypothetical protein
MPNSASKATPGLQLLLLTYAYAMLQAIFPLKKLIRMKLWISQSIFLCGPDMLDSDSLEFHAFFVLAGINRQPCCATGDHHVESNAHTQTQMCLRSMMFDTLYREILGFPLAIEQLYWAAREKKILCTNQ